MLIPFETVSYLGGVVQTELWLFTDAAGTRRRDADYGKWHLRSFNYTN